MSELDTQVLDPEVQDPNVADGNDPDTAGAAEPFFKLNDRQVYNTREDLAQSMTEAAKVAAAHSEIRKVAKEFGIEADPKLIRSLFSELVTARSEKAKAVNKPTEATPSAADANVDPKTADAVKWLKENGFITKDEAKSLKDEIDALKNGMSAKDEESRGALVAEGQEAVAGWLKDAKMSDGKPVDLNDDEQEELESTIAAWVNASPTRIDRFYKGGNTSLNLVKEGFTKALPLVRSGAVAFPNPAAKVAANGKTKTELVNRTPKRMPSDGSSAAAKENKPLRIGDPRLHKQAVDQLKARFAEMAGGGE